MAGDSEGRSLEQTPTWAVAVVCFVLVLTSILIEFIIHLIGKWLKKKHKRALYEALEKIKSELMLMGFISLLLTVGQGLISNVCIPQSVASTWHPCSKKEEEKLMNDEHDNRRRLLSLPGNSSEIFRRVLATGTTDKCADKGKVPFVSPDGIHQLHIFIFVLAVFHVLCCILTMALGRAKMRSWNQWEKESRTIEYQFSHDPERFRFARETSFGRRHLSFWTKHPLSIWIVCFFRQFVRSVPKVDYLTLRHGFIMAHLAPQSNTNFDFQKYINRSLEEDFKVVVGISPPIWFLAVLFLLFNTDGWYAYLWLPFIPLIIILLVGTKLQVIITRMGLRIQDRGEVVKGVPVVQPGDDLFWFNRPHLILYLINFVLFQNAFQLAFFVWSWFEFGLRSCFHEKLDDVIIKISMGILVQILCSYVTLPLYALVTQMGSTMKPTIFDERIATALRNWHYKAKKQIKQNKNGSLSPVSSRPTTPSHHTSPVHLLRHFRDRMDSLQTSPRRSNVAVDQWDADSPSLSHYPYYDEGSSSHHKNNIEEGNIEHGREHDEQGSAQVAQDVQPISTESQIAMGHKDFSFDRSSRVFI
ncbi:Mlo domain-containing protein [Cephalotus follicularis]|uniref:MLO-like protein n=1 Tax=Cephalotus follicularis TaxID=3775 RepID=A0A1Q3CCY3_CEPFO|nr:Mlo domain-containing protein [Cephalotus follicularis]